MLKGAIDQLDSKQISLFKGLVKFYESKQYKKGLRDAKVLLDQVPNHSGTMSMTGLFLYFTGQKTEGFDLSKKALYKNLKSDIAWHIYGIINRSNRNYQEAISCYKKALEISPENTQILTDLALLQVQIRDIEGLCQTRRLLLINKDSVIINWVAYAYSLHLKGDYAETLSVIDSIYNLLKSNPLTGVKKSEFKLFHAQVFADIGDYAMQLKTLEYNEEDIIDKTIFHEMKASALSKLGKSDLAITEIEKLIELNPCNKQFYLLLKDAKGVPQNPTNEEERLKIVNFFDETSAKYKQNIIAYLALEFSQGEDFEKKLIQYILPYFRKGIPSLFSELKHLYSDKSKIQIIEKVLLENGTSLSQNQQFVGSDKLETPCCLLWNYMVLAQHYDRVGQIEKALHYVNKSIEHTPTLIELYLVKAKIYKHQFNHILAFEETEKARIMDLADRYLNNKAIKYALRCGKIDLANDLLRLFLKDPSEGNPYELQSLWFEIAQGQILLKRGEYTRAMRMFKFVQKAFIDIYEDQFDFHTYCLRRYNLNSYTNLLKFENQVYNQDPFIQACTILIKSLMEYVNIKPLEIQKKQEEEQKIKKMSQKEKKLWRKQQEMDAEREAKDPFSEFKKKNDLDGNEFRECQPFLEANNVAKYLVHTTTNNQYLQFLCGQALADLYIQTNRPLLLIKSLNKIIKSNWCKNNIHQYKLKTAIYLTKYLAGDKLNPVIQQIAQETLQSILNGKTIEELNTQHHASNSQAGVRNRLHKIKSDITLGKATQADLLQFYLTNLSSPADLSLKEAVKLYDEFIQVNKFQENPEISASLKARFPESEYYFSVKRFDEKYQEEEQRKKAVEQQAQAQDNQDKQDKK